MLFYRKAESEYMFKCWMNDGSTYTCYEYDKMTEFVCSANQAGNIVSDGRTLDKRDIDRVEFGKLWTSDTIPDNFLNSARFMSGDIIIPSTVAKLGNNFLRFTGDLATNDISLYFENIDKISKVGTYCCNSTKTMKNLQIFSDTILRNLSNIPDVFMNDANVNVLNITADSNIETIGDFFFYNNDYLKKVNISKDCNIQSIGRSFLTSSENFVVGDEFAIPEYCNINAVDTFKNCNSFIGPIHYYPASYRFIGSDSAMFCSQSGYPQADEGITIILHNMSKASFESKLSNYNPVPPTGSVRNLHVIEAS